MLFLFFACDLSSQIFPSTEEVRQLSPMEQYQQMATPIENVIELWVEHGNMDEKDPNAKASFLQLKNSKKELEILYQTEFWNIQPKLYELDPLGCTQLELEFGRFLANLDNPKAKKRRSQGKALLLKLKDEMSALPVPKTPVSEENATNLSSK